MIEGIGVDCVQIERIQKSMARDHFAKRVFSEQERALFAGRGEKHAAESAAGCFAAKEAFLKATGKGLGGFMLGDIAVLRHPSGEPYFKLAGEAAAYCEERRLHALLSLTHDAGLAIAFVVLETALL